MHEIHICHRVYIQRIETDPLSTEHFHSIYSLSISLSLSLLLRTTCLPYILPKRTADVVVVRFESLTALIYNTFLLDSFARLLVSFRKNN